MGSYPDKEFEFKGVLEVAKAYRAKAVYDSKLDLRLVRPFKTAAKETISIEWEDPWGALPEKKPAKNAARPVTFQVTYFETRILANNRRRTVFSCMIESFGNRGRAGKN